MRLPTFPGNYAQRFIQDIRHLVLEVLRGHYGYTSVTVLSSLNNADSLTERVDQIAHVLALERDNFAAGSSDV